MATNNTGAAPLVSDNEIRADFAQKLTRRFEAMAQSTCRCIGQKLMAVHGETCPGRTWDAAARIVVLELADANGEER